MAATISLVVPVLNEGALIGEALAHFAGLGAEELIVVDGGSQDGTDRVARAYSGVSFLRAGRGRAQQMNAGARASTGAILLFAHADMAFPSDAIGRIRSVIGHGAVGGCFFKRYESAGLLLRSYEWGLNHLFLVGGRRMVGTNGLFVRRDCFMMLGGFPDVPILEDLIFADRLRLCGRLGIVREPVVVSARRYVKAGALKQILVNGRILLAHDLLHRSPSQLRTLYAQRASQETEGYDETMD